MIVQNLTSSVTNNVNFTSYFFFVIDEVKKAKDNKWYTNNMKDIQITWKYSIQMKKIVDVKYITFQKANIDILKKN